MLLESRKASPANPITGRRALGFDPWQPVDLKFVLKLLNPFFIQIQQWLWLIALPNLIINHFNSHMNSNRHSLAHQLLDQKLEQSQHNDSLVSFENNESDRSSVEYSSPKGARKEVDSLEKKLLYLEQRMQSLDLPCDDSQHLTYLLSENSLKLSKRKNIPRVSKDQHDQETFKNSKITKNKQALRVKGKQNRENYEPEGVQPKSSRSNKKVPTLKHKKDISHLISLESVNAQKSRNTPRSNTKESFRSNSKSVISYKSKSSVKQAKQAGLLSQKQKIVSLERQLKHCKALVKRQSRQLEQYREMQIEFQKLQANFLKSERIRKEQKKLLEQKFKKGGILRN